MESLLRIVLRTLGGVLVLALPGLIGVVWARRRSSLRVSFWCGIILCLLAGFGNMSSDEPQLEGLIAAGVCLCGYGFALLRISRKTPAATGPSAPAPAPTPEASDRSGSAGAGCPPTDGASRTRAGPT